ncbi:hypothetical protein [Parahaliea mediterranea]|uniref:Uncharacterized protein n=1 Tax=Parahaliea mediterranea TaxID=651086 RepID=A0A939ING2_9GAMM|nr:hypothetical protein [Parahaliea mediterranea]MBN7798093.1 hypothetical protein [Parahaliea mediterranea]
MLALNGFACGVLADGLAIDKVYHPYVDPLAWELEWRVTHADYNPASDIDREEVHRFGLAKAVAPELMLEGYLIAERSANQDLKIEGYELEALWQLTEQGEKSLDYGLLFELEKERGQNAWEGAASLLLERELGRYSVTANIELGYEWGEDIRDEWETGLALQARYRYRMILEPMLEFYLGEDTVGLGPAAQGNIRLGGMKSLHWQTAVVVGVDGTTPDYTLRGLLEYEF